MHVFPIIYPYILLLWEGRKQKLHLPAMIEPVYSDCHSHALLTDATRHGTHSDILQYPIIHQQVYIPLKVN